MALLDLRRVYKTFNPGTPDEVRALRGVDLTIEPGSFVVVIGTNGSGKSTTLNAVAGSFRVDAGTIRLAGRDITDWPEHRRADADRPGLPGPAGRHLAVAVDRREPRAGRSSRPSPRARSRRVPPQDRRATATGSGRSAWAWKTGSTTRSAASPAASARR